MEGTTYVDLFATKGIEYLLVIGFLTALVFFWRFLNGATQRPRPATAPARSAAAGGSWFELPARGVLCHQGHCWARPEPDGSTFAVGIDDFAQKLLGRLQTVVLPRVGQRIRQGEQGWQVEVDSTPIDLLAPVGGEVVEWNHEVLRRPELVNEDPYGRGWLMKVRVPRVKRNVSNLLGGSLALAWMEQAAQSLRRRMSGQLGEVLQDGGVPVVGIAKNLSPDKWDELAREFLLTGESSRS